MKARIDQAREAALWRALDEVRGRLPAHDFLEQVRHLRDKGEMLTVSDLMYLQERTSAHGGSFAVPATVARFLLLLLEGRQIGSLLDPAGGFGLLPAWLAHGLPEWDVGVVTPRSEAGDLLRPLNLPNLALHVGPIEVALGSLAESYAAIVSIPPISGRKEHRSYEVDGTRLDLLDDPSLLVFADLASRLDPKGFFAVVVPPRFASEKSPRSIRQNLPRFGLHLSALLKFRPGTFAETDLAFDLAILDRKPRESLFVAEVPESDDAQKALVARLRKRKQGPTPRQGRLVAPDQFYGLATLEARERYGKLVKAGGLGSVPFNRAVQQINSAKRGAGFERFEEHPHAVYLPEMARTNATTRQDELPSRLKSYYQLLVDPAVVLPEYLAGFLNTEMGHAFRQMLMTGATIPRINQSLLAESKFALPSLADQRAGLLAGREIRRLRTELAELESKLWRAPRDASAVGDAVRKVNHEQRFADWVETLPFPLASILRSYHAVDRTPKEKYERLLYFFEALAEFCAAIHLSAIRTSPAHWEVQRTQIKEVLRQQHLSLEKASFGAWRAVAELMSARLRAMLANDDKRAIACELYATADAAPLEMLASSELAGLFQHANEFRNRWTGHGGAVTQAEAAERYSWLEDDLAKVREIIATNFLRYQLIEPREAEIMDGPVFRCQIRRVGGSNPLFEYDSVDLTTPAKTGRLYLHNSGHDKALELLPLVEVRDLPQPASYFYNRLEKTEPHLVSYHLTAQSDVSSTSAVLLDLLEEFGSEEPRAEEYEA